MDNIEMVLKGVANFNKLKEIDIDLIQVIRLASSFGNDDHSNGASGAMLYLLNKIILEQIEMREDINKIMNKF